MTVAKKNKTDRPETDNKPATMDTLQARLGELSDQATVIENTADAEHRDMTAEEVKEVQSLVSAFKEVEEEIAARKETAEMKAKLNTPQRRLTQPVDSAAHDDEEEADEEEPAPRRAYARVTGGMPSGATKGKWGFRSMGDFAIAAIKTGRGMPDSRILNAPSSFGSEGQSADGGFAIPPDFRQDIMKQVMGEESLLSRCDQQTTSSNSISLPLDTVTPWDTASGVLTSWTGEGATIGGSKPKLGMLETKLNKLTALVPLTDEILEDVPAMTRWLQSKVPDKITSALNTAIVAGSGVGQPLGLLNSGAKVIAAAKSGQGANTVVYENISGMFGRLYAKLRPNAVWLLNQDVEPQLQNMVAPGATFPAYLPPGGLSATPYGMLMGRPVIPIEAAKALGTEGDIILTDLSQYLAVLKSSGLRSDVSIHLYFDADITAFRFILRMGGQPYWPAPIGRQNGSNTLSSIVTLNGTRT